MMRGREAVSVQRVAGEMEVFLSERVDLPEQMVASARVELLQAHYETVVHQVVRYNGTIVNLFDAGSLARFTCACSAVRCALALREDLRCLGVAFRAGLHVGEAEMRSTENIGSTASVANEICRMADSGRVLASGTLADLVAGPGLVFEDAGAYLLEDGVGEEALLAITRDRRLSRR
jgi:class 3 adenylate cyclase